MLTMNLLDFFLELPTLFSFLIIVGTSIFFSIVCIFLFKKFILKNWEGADTNDNISFYLSTFGVFYGIMFGLHTVGVWENYESASNLADEEASNIVSLYRDSEAVEQFSDVELTDVIRDYTKYIYTEAWAKQADGIAKTNGKNYLTKYRDELLKFDPENPKEEILLAEVYSKYNDVIELRRKRLSYVDKQVPFIIWSLIIIGSVVTIVTSSLFHFDSIKQHILLNSFMGLTIGSFIFLVVMLDNPFKGNVSVSSDPYKLIYNEYMLGK